MIWSQEDEVLSEKWEEFCRHTLGNHAYPLFGLDKLLTYFLKHLIMMCNDETVNKLIGLFVYHTKQRPYLIIQQGSVGNQEAHLTYPLSHSNEEVFIS